MNTKKPFGLVLGVSLLAAGLFYAAPPASASQARSFSLLNAQSLVVSNTLNVTNLDSPTIVGATNRSGTVYTNRAGAKVVANVSVGGTASAGVGETINLLNTAPMPSWHNAVAPLTNYATVTMPVVGALYVDMVGGSGANSAVSFYLAPVFGDDPTAAESTAAADLVTVAITATTTTRIRQSNIIQPPASWVGAKWLRLRAIYNADADASSDVTIYQVSFNGEFD